MKLLARFSIVAAVIAGAAVPAHALTLDFEELGFDGDTAAGPRGIGSPLVLGAFQIVATDPFGLPPILVYGRQSTNNPDLGGTSIFPNRTIPGFTISRTDGTAFTFNALGLTFAFDDQNGLFSGGLATFTFNGTDVETRAFDNLPGFETFTFDRTGVTSVQISSASAFAIDDVVLNEAAGAVPEPATWAMMLGGFGLVGGALRSRRKAAVSFG